jgi:hypothetical protein
VADEQDRKLREFERNHDVPSVGGGINPWSNRDPWDMIFNDAIAAENEVLKLDGEFAGNKAKIAEIEDQISSGLIPEQIDASSSNLDATVAARVALLTERLLYYEQCIANVTERHARVPIWELQVRRLREDIERAKRSGGVDETGKQVNPDFAKAKQEQSRLAIELELKRKRAADLAKKKDDLPELRRLHNGLKADWDDAVKTRDALRQSYATKERQHAELKSLGQFWFTEREAFAADEATYPQVWLIAAAGCIAGMIAAFVLLIIADFFQNTFKTVDDVQRGLPVPVLGVEGYMESDAERRLLRRRRIAMSLSSVAALLLVSAVIGLYLWDKTKLPVFVYSVLDKVLGQR